MGLIDYTSVDNIALIDTGLISLNNKFLLEFFNKNGIVTVGNLLRKMDYNDYKKEKYKDIVNEVLGLVDLLKYKYFNMFFINNSYLNSYIREEKFTIVPGNNIMLPSVKYLNNKKINLYSAITRLGFNDRDRTIILNTSYDQDDKLIDILGKVYNQLYSSNNIKEEDKVLLNKLFLYLKAYNKINIKDNEDDKYNYIYSKLEELEELYTKRQMIDDRISEIMNTLSVYGIFPKDNKKK